MDGLKMKKGDYVAIGLVCLMALLLIVILTIGASAQDHVLVEIYQDGVLREVLPFNTLMEYTVEGPYRNVISIEDGHVRVASSDCPGEDCVHTGSVSEAGRSIVCLPNKMELRLVGVGEADVDITVG